MRPESQVLGVPRCPVQRKAGNTCPQQAELPTAHTGPHGNLGSVWGLLTSAGQGSFSMGFKVQDFAAQTLVASENVSSRVSGPGHQLHDLGSCTWSPGSRLLVCRLGTAVPPAEKANHQHRPQQSGC